MSKIEAVRKDVMAWRRAHGGRRGPLPIALRRRAGELAGQHGEGEVSQALDLPVETVRGWSRQYGTPTTPRREGAQQAFVEVGPEVGAALVGSITAAAPPTIKVEVTRPCGTVVRLEGGADTKALLETLLEVVVRRTA